MDNLPLALAFLAMTLLLRRFDNLSRRYREALVRIAGWNGDCVDHPDTCGSLNPREIAVEALESAP